MTYSYSSKAYALPDVRNIQHQFTVRDISKSFRSRFPVFFNKSLLHSTFQAAEVLNSSDDEIEYRSTFRSTRQLTAELLLKKGSKMSSLKNEIFQGFSRRRTSSIW